MTEVVIKTDTNSFLNVSHHLVVVKEHKVSEVTFGTELYFIEWTQDDSNLNSEHPVVILHKVN